ncbi:cadherin-related family member 3 isoform X1 [Gopherus evgoodei]|uniref:cadherin-related family member 3 isoform X1 n=2 Tax=Gopherus evgoodei TaxID=1825980 RepID=UPI0011CF2F4D|nr:cadherin-related family member 3 isoform X1 [Gopherus evgoodei]
MDGRILGKRQNIFFLLVLLGRISGRETLSLNGLPATGNVTENSSAYVLVYTFSVTLSPSPSEVAPGYPLIINSNPLTKAFRIDPGATHTYKVVTTGDPVLDYETMPNSFDLQIYVNDTAGASDLQILTVQITDVNEPPVFRGNLADQTVMIYILEGNRTPPGVIYQIDASDPEQSQLTYSCTPVSESFTVSQTGTISSTKEFDFERDPHTYVLNVTVTDHLGLSTTRTVIVNIININDETPYFTTKEKVYRIPEETSPGTVVGNITAKDPDGEGIVSTLVYSISPPNMHFSINPFTGVIYVAMRIDRDAAPLRLHPNISLVIRVEDNPSGGQMNEMEVTVIIEDLNDNPPECSFYNFRLEVYETATAGTLLLGLRDHCQDIDVEPSNNEFNFTGLSGLGSNKFTLNPSGSGRIVLIGDLDFENPDNLALEEYTLTVVVQDIAQPYYTNNIYIYIKITPVNEFFPVFNSPSYVFSVSEITRAGSSIGEVRATDKDLPFTGITYSIVAGGGTLSYTNIFWIDPNEGNLEIIATLDYETTQKYILTVQASDTEKLATVSVTINVLEVNDEKPVCSANTYSLAIPVDLTVGTNIEGFRIECVDRDSSPRSFRYFINSGNVNNHFTFSPSAGSNISQLILASRFDYDSGLDTIWDYRLHVYITDDNLLSGSNRATALIETGTVTLSIKVIPNPTTTTTTTPAITLLIRTENVYSESAWYVPFLITVGSMLLLGLLGYLAFLLAKYIRTYCPPKPKADKRPLKNTPEKKKVKKEEVWEMTKINTVFDGEARDPVTGKMYEYNSKSGARRWKDTKESMEPGIKDPLAQEMTKINAVFDGEARDPVTGKMYEYNSKSGARRWKDIKESMEPGIKDPLAQVISTAPANSSEGKDRTGTASKQEAGTTGRELAAENNMAAKPSEGKAETSSQDSLKLHKPKDGAGGRGSSSPGRSPVPSPKIYPQLQPKPASKNVV